MDQAARQISIIDGGEIYPQLPQVLGLLFTRDQMTCETQFYPDLDNDDLIYFITAHIIVLETKPLGN